jgi:uncharacterized protein (DUF2141 family)
MKLILSILALILLVSPQNNNFKLTVSVTGLKPLKGDLYISLHNRSEYFQVADSAFMKKRIAIKKETESVVFEGVPSGTYAIALYHDENLDGAMAATENGFPKEGYGFSVKSKFFGRPKFEQAAFDVGGNDTVEIKMVYPPAGGNNNNSMK